MQLQMVNKRPLRLISLHGVLNQLRYNIQLSFMSHGHVADVKYHVVFFLSSKLVILLFCYISLLYCYS